jgi:hypothetical protein
VTSVSANHLVGKIQGVGDVLRNRSVANIRINGGDPGRKEMVNASFTYLQIREGQASIAKLVQSLQKYNKLSIFLKKSLRKVFEPDSIREEGTQILVCIGRF